MKRSTRAKRKVELATSILAKGGSSADATRAIKKKFGSGISSNTLAELKRDQGPAVLRPQKVPIPSMQEALDAHQKSFDRAVNAVKRGNQRLQKQRAVAQMEGQEPIMIVDGERVQLPPGLPIGTGTRWRRFVLKNDVGGILAEGLQMPSGRLVIDDDNYTIEWLDP